MEQQRQLRLGDTLDDYCPRERRLTDHAIVAMVGQDVKQTRCTACDTEHEYKQGKAPRLRRKPDSPAALYGQVAAGAPKRVVHEPPPAEDVESPERAASAVPPPPPAPAPDDAEATLDDQEREDDKEEGPVHRPLIRASLPRPEGQPPPARPIPEFTIRQPGGGRPGRFRPRHERGGGAQQFFGNRGNGNMGGGGGPRGGGQRPGGGQGGQGGGRPPQGGDPSHPGRRHGHGRRRPK